VSDDFAVAHRPSGVFGFTRRAVADVPRGLGNITNAKSQIRLQTVGELVVDLVARGVAVSLSNETNQQKAKSDNNQRVVHVHGF